MLLLLILIIVLFVLIRKRREQEGKSFRLSTYVLILFATMCLMAVAVATIGEVLHG